MAKHMYAMFQEVATKLRSIASENKQLTNKNFSKYLRSSSSENRVPIKQKQGNLTLKCLRYLFTLKKSSSVIVTNKQTNNQLECQILADPRNCIFQPQSTVSSLLTSVKGQGEKKRGKEKWDKTKQNNAQCCGYQDRLGLVFSCVGFPCTSGILPHALVQTVPNCGSGQRCSPSKFPLHNKSASTLIQIFTKTRLSFDPGGTTIILPNEAISAQRNQCSEESVAKRICPYHFRDQISPPVAKRICPYHFQDQISPPVAKRTSTKLQKYETGILS